MSVLVSVHAFAAVIWVGGMFFAYVVLRPSAGPLALPERLCLWHRVFARFFPWVWASILVLLASGYSLIFIRYGGVTRVGLHIHVMQAAGIVMMLLFICLYLLPWRRFRQAVERRDFAEAAKDLDRIRRIVAINLALGILTVLIGASGRFL